jgi:ComF family protein
MLAHLLALIAPPRCAACAAPTGAGRRLCRECHGRLPWLRGPVCGRCALPVPCGPPCPAERAAFSSAWSPVAFEGPARALVHALKFHGRTAAAELMAAHIAANAPPAVLAPAVTLVPAPTHPQRRRERGFDQAQLLARALARRTGLPALAALSRQGPATRQLGAGRAQRRSGIRVAVRHAVAGPVVLIDDVHTTGATLDACAGALRRAGAGEVVAVAYARTLNGR